MSAVVLDMTPWYPFTEQTGYTVLISTSATGKEQRRLLNVTPIRKFRVNFGIMNKTLADELETFYKARYGEYDSWYFPNNNDRILNENIGNKSIGQTHTAASPPIGNIRMVDAAGVKAEGVDYTVNRVTGVFTFLLAVTSAFVNYDPCIQVRFVGELVRAEISNGLFQMESDLIEVL